MRTVGWISRRPAGNLKGDRGAMNHFPNKFDCSIYRSAIKLKAAT